MSTPPTGPRLSDRLKHLQSAEAPLPGARFGIDDVIRGGRRRRRRRTVASVAAGIAVLALGAGLVVSRTGEGTGPVLPPAATPSSATASIAALPPVDLAEDTTVTYRQSGKEVTATRKDGPVATITLTSATYTSTGGHIVFDVDAARTVTVDTAMFLLYDIGGGENAPDSQPKLRLTTGRHTITLDYSGVGAEPGAVGWAAADGSAMWAR